jgi:hypothetical protein
MACRSLDFHSPANAFDGPGNVINLSPGASALWNLKGIFTLKQLEVSDTALTIRFYLHQEQLLKHDDQIMLISISVRSRWPTNSAGNGIARLDFADCSTSAGHLITSGDDSKITTTADPIYFLPGDFSDCIGFEPPYGSLECGECQC